MRRVFQTAALVVCLAAAVGAPRGLLLAAVAAGVGVARTVHARHCEQPADDGISIDRNADSATGPQVIEAAERPPET